MVGILLYLLIVLITIFLAIFVVINIVLYIKDFIKEIKDMKSLCYELNLWQKIAFWSTVVTIIITAIIFICIVIYNTISLFIK